jgi:hypothetical protein
MHESFGEKEKTIDSRLLLYNRDAWFMLFDTRKLFQDDDAVFKTCYHVILFK